MRKPNLTGKRARALRDVLNDANLIIDSYNRTDPRHAAVEYMRDLVRWKLGRNAAQGRRDS